MMAYAMMQAVKADSFRSIHFDWYTNDTVVIICSEV